MTFDGYKGADSTLEGAKRSFPHNMSPDCIIPRRRGGKYETGNVAFVCVYCNAVKAGFRRDNALVLIDELRQAKWRLVGGFLEPAIPAARPSILSNADDELLSAWTKAKTKTITASGARDQEDVLTMIKEYYVGHGLYQDPTGAVLPLGVAEIDKMIPELGYITGNMRPLLGGLNYSKRDTPNDGNLAEWLTDLKSHGLFEETEQLRLAGVMVPNFRTAGERVFKDFRPYENSDDEGDDEDDDEEDDDEEDDEDEKVAHLKRQSGRTLGRLIGMA